MNIKLYTLLNYLSNLVLQFLLIFVIKLTNFSIKKEKRKVLLGFIFGIFGTEIPPFIEFLSFIIILSILIIIILFVLICREGFKFLIIVGSILAKNLIKTFERTVYCNNYSIFLDILFPILLLSGSFIIFFIPYSITTKVILYGLYYFFILNPFIVFWSIIRNWEPLPIIYNLKNPIIIRHFITSLVYPYYLLIILGTLRYFALGHVYTPIFFKLDVSSIVYVIFISPYIFLFFLRFKSLYFSLKEFYLKETYLVTRSLHLYFLRNIYYKKVMEVMSKYWWIPHLVLGRNSSIYASWHDKNIKISNFRKMINKLYDKPQIFSLIMLLFVFLEMITTKTIFYSSYLLFYYFILDLFVTGLYNIGYNNIIIDCCYSNYLNPKSWNNPYYPHIFGTFCEEPEMYRCASVMEIPEDILLKIQEKEVITNKNIKYFWKWDRKLDYAVMKTNLGIMGRVKLHYQANSCIPWDSNKYYNKIEKRFGHTTTKLHHSTALFFTKPIEKMALIKTAPNWVNSYTSIQMLEKVIKPEGQLPEYKNTLNETIKVQKPSSLCIQPNAEYNLICSLNDIVDHGVAISYHQDIEYTTKKQPCPDICANFRENRSFLYRGILGVDQKSSPKGIASHNIISESLDRYRMRLENFRDVLNRENLATPENRHVLNLLADCNENEDSLRKFLWCNSLHLFPQHRIPPLNTKFMIDSSQFSPATLTSFDQAEKEIEYISSILHKDFPNQRNRSWEEIKVSIEEIKNSKNTAIGPRMDTIDLLSELINK